MEVSVKKVREHQAKFSLALNVVLCLLSHVSVTLGPTGSCVVVTFSSSNNDPLPTWGRGAAQASPGTQHPATWAELGSEGGGWLWHSQHELMSGDMGFSDLNWEPGCLQGL